MLIPPEPPRLHLSHDADFHWLVALEFGRVGEDQPQECWVPLSATFAYLLDAPDGRVVGFRVNAFDTFDPEDPEVAAIWDAPRFDAPALGLTNVTAGEIALAARGRYGETDSLNRKIFGVAMAHQGEEALVHWQHCLEAGDAAAHYAIGYTLLGLNRPQEAYGHLRHYTEIAPMGAWNWCWYGQAAEAVGELSEARRAYRRAIELAAGDSAGAGTDAEERLAGLPGVVDGMAGVVVVEAGTPVANRAGEGLVAPPTEDPGERVCDGTDPADPDACPTIAFDGRDLPEHGPPAVVQVDTDLAAGMTAGARPKAYPHTDVNEDAVRVLRVGTATVLLVADGHRGESSARIAADMLAELFEIDPGAVDDDAELLEKLTYVNEVVRTETAEAGQPESRTTLAVAVVDGGRVRWIHMGDSLLAIVEPDGTVRRLGHPRHRFLGWPMDQDGVDAAVERGFDTLAPGGWLVVASDGLPDFVADWREAVLNATGVAVTRFVTSAALLPELRPPAGQVVSALIDAAGEGGAGDNVSVAVLGRAPEVESDAQDTAEQAMSDGAARTGRPTTSRPPDRAAPTVSDRIRGGLLGGAVGDALGAGIEFDSLDRIRRRFGPAGLTDPAPAYGRESAITDDTQLALFTAEGLLRSFTRSAVHGLVHPPGMVDMAYARWLRTQGEESLRNPREDRALSGHLATVRGLRARRGPGRTTIAATRGAIAGELGVPTNASKGSGAVARSTPIGLIGDPSRAFQLACECAVLTHGHRTGHLAAGALGLIVASVRDGVLLRPALDRALAELRTWDNHEETTEALVQAIELAEITDPVPQAVAALGQGWVAEEALAIAVYCALQARDLEHGLLLAVNHGGASPTTGAICGALLGTMLGADAIPRRWLATLELRETIEEVADALDAAFGNEPRVSGEESDWWERWPGV